MRLVKYKKPAVAVSTLAALLRAASTPEGQRLVENTLKWGKKGVRSVRNYMEDRQKRSPKTGKPKRAKKHFNSSAAFSRPVSKPNATAITGSRSTVLVKNYYKGKPVRFNPAIASGKLSMVRTSTNEIQSTVGQQKHGLFALMDCSYNIEDASNQEKEVNQMFQIAKLNQGNLATNDLRLQKLYVQSCRQVYEGVNTTNGAIRVIIRVIKPKFDTNFDPQVYWSRAARIEDNADNDNNTTVGFGPYNHIQDWQAPNATPMQIEDFRRNYVVVQRKVIELEPGQQFKHITHVEYRKIMKAADMFTPGYFKEGQLPSEIAAPTDTVPTATTGLSFQKENKTFLKDWTVWTMFSVLGPKASTKESVTGTAPNQTIVPSIHTYAAGELSLYHHQVTSFYNYPKQDAQKYIINNIPTATANGDLYMPAQDGDGGEYVADFM